MFDNDKDDPSSFIGNLSFSNTKMKREQSSFIKKKSQPDFNFNQMQKTVS